MSKLVEDEVVKNRRNKIDKEIGCYDHETLLTN